jgi:glycerol-3-phosphate cytidylyltransferase-like family protein
MRVMVDMSATVLHHGHVRLLKRAKELGTVIVGLRKEVLEALRFVDEVVETPWLITDELLYSHNIDALLHGTDNSNDIQKEKLILASRTEGISISDMRIRSLKAMVGPKTS